jgi:iron complex transport system permease protein
MTMFLTPTRSHKPLTPQRLAMIVGLMSLLLLAAVLTSLSIGSVGVPLRDVFGVLIGDGDVAGVSRTIVFDIRLPRILLAILVGGGLSIAGLVLQALLRNPLAEPYILGISSGGTLGAILAVALAWGPIGTPAASFAGSAAVMLLVYMVAHRRGQLDTYTLLLAGVMIGAFFNAVILLVIALFNQELHNAFLWLMGNLSGAASESLWIITPFVALAAGFFLIHAKDYNLVSTGEEAASQLGVHVKGLKRSSYIAASLITGLVVSVSGVVGFVGLIIPHICRLLFGPDHRLLLPVSAIMGAFFLVCADLLARTLIAPAEIPVGAVTAAIGAPVFVYLLRTR